MKSLTRGMAFLAALVAFQLLAFGIAGADSVSVGAGSSATPTMDRINKTGVLRVGVSAAQPPFSMTARSGDVLGLDVDLANAKGATLLHAAAASNRPEIAVMLIERGARLDAKAGDELRPLHMAAMFGGPEIVRLFVDAGAEVDARNSDRATALLLAARLGRTEGSLYQLLARIRKVLHRCMEQTLAGAES